MSKWRVYVDQRGISDGLSSDVDIRYGNTIVMYFTQLGLDNYFTAVRMHDLAVHPQAQKGVPRRVLDRLEGMTVESFAAALMAAHAAVSEICDAQSQNKEKTP